MSNVLALTKQLIEIPSVRGNDKAMEEVLDVVRKELSDFTIEDFESKGVKSLLIYKEKSRPEKFKMILNAHLDVVPAKPEQFKIIEKDGKLFARGAYDMKSGAAAMILAFKELAKTLSYPLALQVVTDEEMGGADGAGVQLQSGVRADFVISGEGSSFRIINKTKGIYRLSITAKGQTAHGAYPWNGVNAIAKMHVFLENLWKTFPIPKEPVWETTINVASINTTNQAFNKVPDECAVLLDVRYIPEEKETIIEKIKKLVPEDFSFEEIFHGSSTYTKEDNAFLEKLKIASQTITGNSPKIDWTPGASDTHLFAEYDILGVEFGPIGAAHHTDDEYLQTDSLEAYLDILKNFLQNIS